MLLRLRKLVVLAVVSLILPLAALAQTAIPVFDLDTELQPGVWHGFRLGPSYLDRAYVAEITPLSPDVGGARIERYVVQPEFDGFDWYDVLRVMLPAGSAALDVHIRAYGLVDMPVVQDFDYQLQPGVWHGFILGACSMDRGLVVEVTPLAPHVGGSHIQRYVIQPEYFMSSWIDVLRIMLPAGLPPLDVNIRAYELLDMPVAAEFDFQLQPSVWHEFILGPSSLDRAYVPEFDPPIDSSGGGSVQDYSILPVFDGTAWNDVLRVFGPPAGYPPVDFSVRVHKIPGSAAEIQLLTGDVDALETAGVLNAGQSHSLTGKLDGVIDKMERGNTQAAMNQLNAFINQVEDLVATGVLAPEEGQVLIRSATAILDELNS